MSDQSRFNSGIEVSGLAKSFGGIVALNDISFQLGGGRFLTLFGPNGAGKTTLIKVLALLTKPTSGTASVAGYDLSKQPNRVRGVIGVISHDPYLYPELSAFENLTFFARLYGVSRPEERAREVIEQVGLRRRMHDLVRSFSRGMQQRLAVARALVNDPRVLLLDEPYTGLDQHGAALFTELLKGLREDRRTIVMTTHNVNEGLGISDRVMIIDAGRIVYEEERGFEPMEFRDIYFSKVGN